MLASLEVSVDELLRAEQLKKAHVCEKKVSQQ
jgi:hypothetical protein